MSHAWVEQKERSSAFWISIIRWIALNLGRPVARTILYPISIYFFIFSLKARQASKDYLTRVLDRPPNWLDQLKHFHYFSSTILDRVYLLTGREHLLDIRFHNYEVIEEIMAKKTGCVLLGSHLGSFEVLRALAIKRYEVKLKVLMYENHNETVTRFLNVLNPSVAETVISLGAPDSLLQVKECLDRGEFVGMLGDRVAENDKRIDCELLGGDISLPAGPMLIATTLKVPVVLFYGLYRGGDRYDVHFELLTEAKEIEPFEREKHVKELMQSYAKRLEFYTKQSPYNWFNFYDYWQTS